MPENMGGHHEIYGDNKNIYFRKSDGHNGIQNTTLRVIWEMMEALFVEVQPDYVTLRTRARHITANLFPGYSNSKACHCYYTD
jgi:hypothetical protein